jgi:hypothetical protein
VRGPSGHTLGSAPPVSATDRLAAAQEPLPRRSMLAHSSFVDLTCTSLMPVPSAQERKDAYFGQATPDCCLLRAASTQRWMTPRVSIISVDMYVKAKAMHSASPAHACPTGPDRRVALAVPPSSIIREEGAGRAWLSNHIFTVGNIRPLYTRSREHLLTAACLQCPNTVSSRHASHDVRLLCTHNNTTIINRATVVRFAAVKPPWTPTSSRVAVFRLLPQRPHRRWLPLRPRNSVSVVQPSQSTLYSQAGLGRPSGSLLQQDAETRPTGRWCQTITTAPQAQAIFPHGRVRSTVAPVSVAEQDLEIVGPHPTSRLISARSV